MPTRNKAPPAALHDDDDDDDAGDDDDDDDDADQYDGNDEDGGRCGDSSCNRDNGGDVDQARSLGHLRNQTACQTEEPHANCSTGAQVSRTCDIEWRSLATMSV